MTPDIDPHVLHASVLLGQASRFIRANVASLIEADSNLVSIEPAGEAPDFWPVPGTLDDDAAPYVSQLVKLLRDIDKWIGTPLEMGPQWLDDLLARRNGWENTL
jgi:hypothetical protein